MKNVEGNLLDMFRDGEFDVIVHGCNCFHDMSAGLAAQVANRYPEAVLADKITKYGAQEKLGTISCAELVHTSKQIVNCYTQFHGGQESDLVLYPAIRSVMQKVKKNFYSLKIGLPQIGCGIAGGKWHIVSKIIEEELEGMDVTIVTYKP